MNIDEVFCKFTSYSHICTDAKILPCNETACTACILNSIDKSGSLKCTLCKKTHFIENIDDLPRNKQMKRNIQEKFPEIFQVIFDKFQTCLSNMKHIFHEDNNSLNNWFNYILLDVDIHFESLRQHFDKMRDDIINKISVSKRELDTELSALRTEFKRNLSDYESLAHDIHHLSTTSKLAFETHLMNCQNSIKGLDILKSKHNSLFEKISYEPNDWLPDESFVCNFKYTEVNENKVNFNVLSNSQPVLYDLKSLMEFPSGFCNMDDENFAVADAVKNEILIFDKTFSSPKLCVKEIDGYSFDGPCKLYQDENYNTIYLSDFWNKRILVTNRSLNKIKKVIDCVHLNLESFYPIDFFVHKDNLLVLDRLNKKVYKLDINKNFKLSEIAFTNKVKLKDPVRIQVFSELMVILDDSCRLYFFNFDGVQQHLIEYNSLKISGILRINNLLATITQDGSFTLFERDEEKESFELNSVFKSQYFSLASVDNVHLLYFENKIFASFGHKKSIAAIELC